MKKTKNKHKTFTKEEYHYAERGYANKRMHKRRGSLPKLRLSKERQQQQTKTKNASQVSFSYLFFYVPF